MSQPAAMSSEYFAPVPLEESEHFNEATSLIDSNEFQAYMVWARRCRYGLGKGEEALENCIEADGNDKALETFNAILDDLEAMCAEEHGLSAPQQCVIVDYPIDNNRKFGKKTCGDVASFESAISVLRGALELAIHEIVEKTLRCFTVDMQGDTLKYMVEKLRSEEMDAVVKKLGSHILDGIKEQPGKTNAKWNDVSSTMVAMASSFSAHAKGAPIPE